MPITEGGGRQRTSVRTKARRSSRRTGGVVTLKPKSGGGSTRSRGSSGGSRGQRQQRQPQGRSSYSESSINRGASPRSAPGRPGSSGSVERVTPKPKVPSLGQYLGTDEVYQQALRGGRRSLSDFLSEIGRRKGESQVQFGQTKSQLELDRTQQLERMRDEFAARGLIHSGLFGEEQGKFQEAFQKQLQQLEQQQAALLQDFLGQERNFRRDQQMAMEVARQEALSRRAARYNIPL